MKKASCAILSFVLFVIISFGSSAVAATGLISDDSTQDYSVGEEIQCGDFCVFTVNDFQFIDSYEYYSERDDFVACYHTERSGKSFQYLFIDCSIFNTGLSENQTVDRILKATLIYSSKYEFEGSIYQINLDRSHSNIFDKVEYEIIPLSLLEEGRVCCIIKVPNIVESEEEPTDLLVTLFDTEYTIPLR